MALKTWHSVFLGALTLAGMAVLGASCGGSGDATTLGGGGAGLGGPVGCTRAGEKCALGCEANLGCVECSTAGDCGPGSPFCVLGRCEACGANADCGTGQACFPGDNQCQTKCTANTNCTPDAPLCDT